MAWSSGAARDLECADGGPRRGHGRGRQRPRGGRRAAAAHHGGRTGCSCQHGAGSCVLRRGGRGGRIEPASPCRAGGASSVRVAGTDRPGPRRATPPTPRATPRARARQAEQQAGYTLVKAPFDGIVSARAVEPGETVAPGQSLLSVYAPRRLRIEVAVPQNRAEAIRRDPRAQVLRRRPPRRAGAPVVVFPAADPMSHSVNVRLMAADRNRAPAPGTTAKVVFAAKVMPPRARQVGAAAAHACHGRGAARRTQRRLRGEAGRASGAAAASAGARIGDEVEVIAAVCWPAIAWCVIRSRPCRRWRRSAMARGKVSHDR